MLLATLPLLLRRRFPFAAPVCVFGAYGALAAVDRAAVSSLDTTTFTLLLAFWAVGAQHEARQAVAGVAIGCASLAVLVGRDARIEPSDGIGMALAGAALALTAFTLERRSRRAAELERQVAVAERERERRERAAVAGERRRIARDLHDVIAHSVGVMTVQAGAARLVLDDPQSARAPLLAVEETGRQALGELRRLLGMLRTDEAEATPSPRPGLADLERLLAHGGELSVEGTPAPLPAGIDVAAYRIVQEALAATSADARVAVRYRHDALELEIVRDGSEDDHALVAMRERVASCGGRLDAGPRSGGGFLVRVHLPLDAPAHPVAPASPPAGDESHRQSRSPHVFDALVVGLAVVSEIELWVAAVPGPKLLLASAVLLYTLPLLLRGRFPFGAPALVFGVQAALTFTGEAVGSQATGFAALLLAFWAVGAQDHARHAIAGVALGLATLAVIVQWDVRFDSGNLLQGAVMLGGISLAAFALHRRSRRAAELERQATFVEREREQRERAAVAEERRRIARDLHDVVAHGVGVMTVQAGAARLLLEEDPERARAPLLAVEETGRQALGELRRLLGILRADAPATALRPQPGLADLEELLAQARGAGLPAELVVEGSPAKLPAGVDLAAYRIVQEGLTNTRKHAGPARAQVAVRYASDALELQISDDGRAGVNGGGGGHGLVGMRERVALYGGQLEAGPRPEGGFSVRARLPLEARP